MTNVSASSMMVIYTYRADGLRHSKTVNGVTTTHVWLRGNIILERNDSGAIINQFDRSLTGRLIRSPQHGYYLFNARGDVVQRVNAQGRVIRNYRYTAFGIELNPNENNRNPFRFAGEYWDAETGTYYLRARNFNPRTGRFTQPDPLWNVGNMQFGTNPRSRHGRMVPSPNSIMQADNLFMYTMHNPVRWVDPTGLSAQLTGVFLPSGGFQLANGIVLRPGASTFTCRVTGVRSTGSSIAAGTGVLGDTPGSSSVSRASGSALVASSITNLYFDGTPNPANLREFNRAIRYLTEGSARARELISIIENGGTPITLEFTNNLISDFCNITGVLRWDPTRGTKLYDGSVRSAANVLAHEFGHVEQWLAGELRKLVPSLRGAERDALVSRIEANNLERWETQIATQLGEPIRHVYGDAIGAVRMNNSTHHRIIYNPGMDHRSSQIIPVNLW